MFKPAVCCRPAYQNTYIQTLQKSVLLLTNQSFFALVPQRRTSKICAVIHMQLLHACVIVFEWSKLWFWQTIFVSLYCILHLCSGNFSDKYFRYLSNFECNLTVFTTRKPGTEFLCTNLTRPQNHWKILLVFWVYSVFFLGTLIITSCSSDLFPYAYYSSANYTFLNSLEFEVLFLCYNSWSVFLCDILACHVSWIF